MRLFKDKWSHDMFYMENDEEIDIITKYICEMGDGASDFDKMREIIKKNNGSMIWPNVCACAKNYKRTKMIDKMLK